MDKQEHQFWVDIPQEGTDEYKNVATFTTRKEAIQYAMEYFGADSKGRITIVSGA